MKKSFLIGTMTGLLIASLVFSFPSSATVSSALSGSAGESESQTTSSTTEPVLDMNASVWQLIYKLRDMENQYRTLDRLQKEGTVKVFNVNIPLDATAVADIEAKRTALSKRMADAGIPDYRGVEDYVGYEGIRETINTLRSLNQEYLTLKSIAATGKITRAGVEIALSSEKLAEVNARITEIEDIVKTMAGLLGVSLVYEEVE